MFWRAGNGDLGPDALALRPGETWARRQAQTPTDRGSSRPAVLVVVHVRSQIPAYEERELIDPLARYGFYGYGDGG